MSHTESTSEKSPTPQDRGFNWRSVFYAAIPLGFIALVVVMVLGGWAVEESEGEGVVDEVVEGEEAEVG